MFRNKALVVNVVKKADVETSQEARDEVSPAVHAAVLMDHAVVAVAVLIGTYMASDTVRKCIIHTVATRVN